MAGGEDKGMMDWSSKPPTEPGLYQYRAPFASVIVFYRIDYTPSGQLVAVLDGDLTPVELSTLPGRWRGPVPAVEGWR